MIKNTVLDFYVAKMTNRGDETIPTYGTPAVLGGSAEVSVDPQANRTNVYESGRQIYNKAHNAGYTVTLSSHTLPLDKIKELCLSVEANAQGEFIEGGDTDTPQEVAVGYPVLLDDGTYLCTWFFDATAALPGENYKTSNENGPQIEPESLEFACTRRPYDRKMRRTKICSTVAAMQAFFAAVEPAT